jgi:predicted enzyme related to lactoylglutathione lyase
MDNAISWFEIPTTDLDRAQKFYEAIFDITLNPMDTPNIKMRMFPLDNMMTGVGGASL